MGEQWCISECIKGSGGVFRREKVPEGKHKEKKGEGRGERWEFTQCKVTARSLRELWPVILSISLEDVFWRSLMQSHS